MVALLAALSFTVRQEAQALLADVKDYYGSLKRFEATIEHHNDSGLFPGEYNQKLVWTAKGTFTLKVTKPSSYKPTGERPGGLAPDYVANGKEVTKTSIVGGTSTESVTPRENTSPGWEVSGGLALSFLEKTETSRLLPSPPKEFKMTWSMGTSTQWKEVGVRELLAKIEGRTMSIHLYLAVDKSQIVGVAVDGDMNGWMIYRDVKTER